MPNQPYWVNLLDMGSHKYGDSIFINHPELKILIDGGYLRLAETSEKGLSIPSQLGDILGTQAPFDLDLLVVTHCHSDHIGCLPKLVHEGVIRPRWALVADPDLGFPQLPLADIPPLEPELLNLAVLAARDEPHDDLEDGELLTYLRDGVTLESRYRQMISELEAMNATVFRYGRDSLTEFRQRFEPLGLTILGPTHDHLRICRNYLIELQVDAVVAARGFPRVDEPIDDKLRLALYRTLTQELVNQDAFLEEDRPGRGSALNNQSIVLLVESASAKALLTGDMQLAKAEVPGLDKHMERLIDKIASRAPFDLHKVAHHSSYNGLNREVLDRLPARVYGHTGGQKSASHPHSSVLSLFRNQARTEEWVRTDRNGRVGVLLGSEPIKLFLSKGNKNDYRPSLASDLPTEITGLTPATSSTQGQRITSFVSEGTLANDFIEIQARVPNRRTRVRLTIDIDPVRTDESTLMQPAATAQSNFQESSTQMPTVSLAAGRQIPRLLFVTSKRLGEVVGGLEIADSIIRTLRDAGHEVIDTVPSSSDQAMEAVQTTQAKLAQLSRASPVHGVVLLGNYDVVPSVALDVLDPDLRRAVSVQDPDRFIVWSDDPFGDLDGDGISELAVSRVPHEAGSAALLVRNLSCASPESPTKFGIRNLYRPFADHVFSNSMDGSGTLLVSGPARHDTLEARENAEAIDYFMLHGSAQDATVFWGESDIDDEGIEAFQIGNVPGQFSGIVFAGCCWGALPVGVPAGWWTPGQPLRARTRSDSIPMRYLAAGASAFIGCTGAHYSPGEEPYTYFGAPLHQTFWAHIRQGYPPALALRQAKNRYAVSIPHTRSIPHIRESPTYSAIELKILQQFTCLGLGW